MRVCTAFWELCATVIPSDGVAGVRWRAIVRLGYDANANHELGQPHGLRRPFSRRRRVVCRKEWSAIGVVGAQEVWGVLKRQAHCLLPVCAALLLPHAWSFSGGEPAGRPMAPITVDYPLEGSLFPPEITAPTFIWHDPAASAAEWRIEIVFADTGPPIRETSKGETLRTGPIDPRCLAATNEVPTPGPYQAAAHTWKPSAGNWTAIKRRSSGAPATVMITGVAGTSPGQAVSRGSVVIGTSKDPAGAPIFYRDVPLMPSELERGLIKPLAAEAVKLIAWRLRNLSETGSRLLLEDLPTCANCHSFSADGRILGIDVDGPDNDKGTYAISAVKPQLSIRSEDVITWNSFPDKPPGQRTIGFMSQISPDGQYAVSTVNESLYVANFKDYRVLQVFYPTRGILGWYNRRSGRMGALPGAADPRYVQTDAVWTPDGKYIVFARAEATDPYPERRPLAAYANDPNEVQIQYDLYRIPFNGGKGGEPQPIRGASQNGMSNSFPKVSPDGRWIVFVQSRNGQLLRPDSRLYIVPTGGGESRRMRCNTAFMNSWHSFSPNGRWLVFSSKSRSPYTQMFLTHIDEDGTDSPAILIENSTAANRAVNIPEFVNIPPDGLAKIDVPAAKFGRAFDQALSLLGKGQPAEAIAEWRRILEMAREDPKVHNNLGVALVRGGRLEEAVGHFQKAVGLNTRFDQAYFNLGCALDQIQKRDEAMAAWRRAVGINGDFAEAHCRIGEQLLRQGKLEEAIGHFQRALKTDPHYGRVRNDLGVALFQQGLLSEAVANFEGAVAEDHRYAEAYYNLGRALAGSGKPQAAIDNWRKAIEISPDYADARYFLGAALGERGSSAEALALWRRGLISVPDHVPLLETTAWTLATCAEASLRNGAEAVKLAERAVALSGRRTARSLDTLAAAYAEAGRFPEAVKAAQKALEMALRENNPQLAGSVKTRLALYEVDTPFRQPARKAN